ncbi:MAG: S41 family peptidase [Myxococcota bacterium]
MWTVLALSMAASHPGYFRQPTLHDETIVFVAEGDLFVSSTRGGLARRLTSHPGMERHPQLSPDGKQVAYVGHREGTPDLYVIAIDGGEARRLTFDGTNKASVGWTPDGRVLMQTDRFTTLPGVELVTVSVDTRAVERIPLFRAAEGAYGPNGRLYFTRLRKQSSHNKRYRGGWMQRIWSWAPGDSSARAIGEAHAHQPMVMDGRLFFLSDRDGTSNLWSIALDGSDARRHTEFSGIGIQEATAHQGRTVLRVGPDLYLWSGEGPARRLEIGLLTDLEQVRVRHGQEVWKYLDAAALGPSGRRVVLTVRGAGQVVPVGLGRTVDLAAASTGRLRSLQFLGPEGDRLIAFGDGETGEMNLYELSSAGTSAPLRRTDYGAGFRRGLASAPDGKKLAFATRDQTIQLVDLDRARTVVIDRSEHSSFFDLAWSADSRWLAYVAIESNSMSTIRLFDTKTGEKGGVSSDRTPSRSPVFGPEGKVLYFLTDRHLSNLVPSPWGDYQPEPYYDHRTEIVGLPLAGPARSPFSPFDELHPPPSKPKEDKASDPPSTSSVRFEGALDRLFQVPMPADNYRDLRVGKDRLYALRGETPFGGPAELVSVSIKPRDRTGPELEVLTSEVMAFDLSANRDALLIRKKNSILVVPASGRLPDKLDPYVLDVSGVHFRVDPKAEWRQMFLEAWRLERDFFYDPGMHGIDWEGMKTRYLPWVERVTNREELSDLVAQMVSELEALHTFVYGGDVRKDPTSLDFGHLGARFQRTDEGALLEHVYVADPDRLDVASPLARPEQDVREGDLLVAVNGRPVSEAPTLGALLVGTAGRQVRLQLQRGKRRFEVIVTPLNRNEEFNLRYSEWQYSRRLRVEAKGNGRIGYVHLRSMRGSEMAEWTRQFHPVQDREALIIDVRNNRGGNIDSWVLEKLLRKAWFYWQPRVGRPYPNMQSAFRGHMLVLINERTASDGEAFAEGFRRLGLGPVYGVRSWGGEIWLNSSATQLVDRGGATAAQYGVYGPEGVWLIEGHGVVPDVEVFNEPHRTFQGEDAQLDRAVDDLLERLSTDPRPVPSPPPYPDKGQKSVP